jgi:hypothetical protein
MFELEWSQATVDQQCLLTIPLGPFSVL